LAKRLNDKLRVARIVLEKLKNGPMRWTALTKAVLLESPTPWKVRSVLKWLLKHGYVDRPERGLYCITDKGLQFLETL